MPTIYKNNAQTCLQSKFVLACSADCPADNQARQLALFLYGTLATISQTVPEFKKLIKPSKIRIWDYIPIGICLCFSIYFLITNQVEFETRRPIVYYSFGIYFFTLFFNYGHLRNINLWNIWFGFSIIQIVIYYKHGLDNTDWPAIRGLRNFWLYLILFQVLRWLSFKLQKQEFVTLSRTQKDLHDDREFKLWDFILFIPAIASIFILQVI